MNSRIYTAEPYKSEPKIYVAKTNFLWYKRGDKVIVDGHSLGGFVYIEKRDLEEDIKTYCYTLAEWRDIQINSILED